MAEARVDTTIQLNCPVCLEILESPKVLPCLHTFCEKCISKHARGLSEERMQLDTIACPMCRCPISVSTIDQTPDDWASKLPSNSIILSILESDKSRKDDFSVYCQPCLTEAKHNVSVAYCITCSEYLCHNCYDCHKKFKATRDHNMTVQSTADSESLKVVQDDLFRCLIHRKKYKHFCSEHREFCCTKCALTDHRKCEDLLAIEDFAKEFKEKEGCEKTSEQLDVLKRMFLTLLQNRSKRLDSLHEEKLEITMSVTEWSAYVKGQVDELTDTILNDLETICKLETIKISDQIIECKSAVAAIEVSRTLLTESIKLDNNKLFLILAKVSQHLLKYVQKYDRIEGRLKDVRINFQRSEDSKKVIQALSSLSQVSTAVPRIPRRDRDISFEGVITMLPRAKPDSVVTFDAKISTDEKYCTISSGIFLPDERIVLSDIINRTVKLFDRSYNVQAHLKMECSPLHMCRVDQGTVAVMCWKSSLIHLVSVTNTLLLLKKINVGQTCLALASYPQHITVLVEGAFVVISDVLWTTTRMIPLDSNVAISTISKDISGAICFSPDGQTIHCKAENKIVTVDIDGRPLNTFESKDLANGIGVAVDKTGVVYCCGSGSNKVLQVSPEGRQLAVFLSHDHGLTDPISLSLNERNNKILVFENKSSKVKVFKLV